MRAEDRRATTHLFECLVVDKAGSVLGYLEGALLDLLAELPVRVSAEENVVGVGVWVETYMVQARPQRAQLTMLTAAATCMLGDVDWRSRKQHAAVGQWLSTYLYCSEMSS